MSKKVVIPQDENESGDKKAPPVKKKRSKCCTCLIAFGVTCLIFTLLIFGAGWFVGDYFTKQYLNMSIGDVLGVVNGLYWTDDDDVVTRSYSDDDLGGFYSEIKKNILLRTDAEVDFDAALDAALDTFLKQEPAAQANYRESVPAMNDGNSDDDDSGVMKILMDMITGVFKVENIDKVRLEGYSPEHDEYIFRLNDKQLAAFINKILNKALESADKISSLSDISEYVPISGDYVKLKQIRFNAHATKNDLGENIIDATTADLTVWLGLQDMAGRAIRKVVTDVGFGWTAGLANWLGDVILPENLYATVTFPLHGDAEPQLTINDMNVEKRDRLYAIVNTFMDSGDGTNTVQSLMKDIVEQVKPLLDSIVSTAGDKMFTDAANGNLDFDLLGMIADMASENLEEGKKIQKSDFMYLLQAVMTSDADRQLELYRPYMYKGWYVDAQNNLVFDPADKTGYTVFNYEDQFVRELERVYALNCPTDEEGNKSVTAILKMLGISLDGEGSGAMDTEDILELIDAQRFHDSFDVDLNELKLQITDKMLASVFDSKIKSLLGEQLPDGLTVNFDAMTFIKKNDKPGHEYALIAVDADVTGMLSGQDNPMMNIVTEVLPHKLLFTVIADITSNLPAGEELDSVSFMLNDYKKTDLVLETITKFVDFDMNSIASMINSNVKPMIDELNSMMHISFKLSDQTQTPYTDGAIVLPDIYTIITDMVFVNADTGEKEITPEQLKKVLSDLDNTSSFETRYEGGSMVADDYSGFIADVIDKYYLKESDTPIRTFNDLTSFIMDGEFGFDSGKFRVNGNTPGVKYMVRDSRSAGELRPLMSGAEIGALVREMMGDGSSLAGFDLMEVRTGDAAITIVMSTDIGSLMPSSFRLPLLSDRLFVTATVDLDNAHRTGDGSAAHPYAYAVDLQINSMAGGETGSFDTLLKIIKHFDSGFDIQNTVAEFGQILYEKINDLTDSLGNENFITFTENGLQMIGFYDFLTDKLGLSGNHTAEDVKSAVQGMFEVSSVAGVDNSEYNYNSADFVINRSTTPAWENTTDLFAVAMMHPTGMTDQEFNGFFDGVPKQMSGGAETSMNCVQTIVLAANDSGTQAVKARSWAAEKLGVALPVTGEYMLITFSLDTSDFAQMNKDMANGFLPRSVYATVVLEKIKNADNKDNFTSRGLIFNNMGHSQYTVLAELMGLSDAPADTESERTVNITTVTNKGLETLNEAGNNGIKITFTALPDILPDALGIGHIKLGHSLFT